MSLQNETPLSISTGSSVDSNTDKALQQHLQSRRFRTVWMPSFLFIAFTVMYYLFGFITLPVMLSATIYTSIGVFGFYVMFRLGLNKRMADKSLALPLTIVASSAVLYVMYEANAGRGALAMVLVMILFLNAFRYSAKPALIQAGVFLAAYAAVIGMAASFKGESAGHLVDIAHWIVMAIAMPWFAYTGTYINTLRDRLRERKAFYEALWETCGDAVIVVDEDFRVQYANPAILNVFGYSTTEVVDLELARLQPPPSPDALEFGLLDVIKAAEAEQGSRTVEAIGLHKDGHLVPTEVTFNDVLFQNKRMFVTFIRDITERRRTEERIRFMAHHDTLTGLPNRALLEDRLTQAISYGQRYGTNLWVVFIDLDRFKFINDTLGHKVGDTLLTTVSKRLQAALRDIDTVARIGGDEFVIVLPEHGNKPLSISVVQRIMHAVAQPVTVDEHELFVTCSIGVSTFPSDASDPDTLVVRADMAMYRAKQTGRNNIQFYTASMNEGLADRLSIEADMHTAIQNDELVLHYQPQLDLKSGRIVGMEALLRWRHPVRGLIPPLQFIKVAEETGLIVPIGEWVLRTACAQNKAWQDAGLGELRVAVNLSARQFTRPNLAQSIADVLKDTGLDARFLDIELTETLVMTDVEQVIGILRELNELGVQLSIDDFGTGYSSLAYLSRFPIDVLKIDKSFINEVAENPDDASIVASIISLAHNLRLIVIAEGVETEAQLAFLRGRSCDEMQGYLFSKPVPADEFELLLREKKQLPADEAAARLALLH